MIIHETFIVEHEWLENYMNVVKPFMGCLFSTKSRPNNKFIFYEFECSKNPTKNIINMEFVAEFIDKKKLNINWGQGERGERKGIFEILACDLIYDMNLPDGEP